MTAKNFLSKLTALAASSKRVDKLAVVKTFNEWERKAVKAALEPTVSYYLSKIPMPASAGNGEFNDAEWELLQNLAERSVSGREALTQVGFSLLDLAPEDGEVLRRIILKDLRCGVCSALVNEAFPNLVSEYSYMRCSLPKASNIDKWNWADGVYVQLKCDGMFARIAHTAEGEILITSRQGNTFPIEALAKLSEDARWVFPAETETHGELTVWIAGELQPRTIGNGLLNSLQQGGEIPEGTQIRFDCWDQIPLSKAVPKGSCTTPYRERYSSLAHQVGAADGTSIMLVEGTCVSSREEAMTYYKGVLARGLEGVILKHPEAVWKDGDSKDQVKFKLEVDVDLQIVGFNPGEQGKRTETTFGSVQCQSIDGMLEVAVSGFKRDMEQYLHENRDSVLGKVMCVRANDVAHPSESNEKHSLFHPRFVELRGDKYEADTLQQVLDQFAAAVA